MKGPDVHLTVDDFCKDIAHRLLAGGRTRLPFDSPDIAVAMSEVAEDVLKAAHKAFAAGEEFLGNDLLTILDDLAPSPSTGAFDGFWSALRSLQPGRAGVENPLYPELKFKTVGAGSEQDPAAPAIWRELVESSVERIRRHL